MTNNLWLRMFDSFYRSGSLVFGGGHVVLPLLENEFVPQGLISPDSFITGYPPLKLYLDHYLRSLHILACL